MGAEIVQAVYRAKPGKVDELVALIEKHEPALRAEGLVSDRPFTVLRSGDGRTFIEVFEWATSEAAHTAHENATIGPLWGAMAEVADFMTLADVAEATKQFPHFTPV